MSLLRSTRLISTLTMFSRVLGLVREQLLAALLGAGAEADAYNIAFRIPNLFRDLLAEGALSAAFVPVFAKVDKQVSREEAFVLGQRVAGVLALVIGALTLLGYLFTGVIVQTIAPGFSSSPAQATLTLTLTQVMLPSLMLTSFAAVAMGMLNAQRIFGPPAFASSAFNIVAITFGVVLAVMHESPQDTAWGWALGVVLGAGAQMLVQVPALLRSGFRLRLRFQIDDNVKAIMRMMAPATLGLAATQLNIVINSRFASEFAGGPASLNYAFRLLYLPIGVFGVAIATVSTTALAERVALGDEKGVRKTIRDSLSLLAFLTVPSSVGLWVLSEPIIAMIYQRRAFTADTTHAVAGATAVYAIGLFAYSAVKVLAPIYYARRRTHVPLIASVVAVLCNIAVSYSLRAQMGFLAMALGTSVAAWANVSVLTLLLGRAAPASIDGEERAERRRAWRSFGKVCIAAAVMGAAGFYGLRALPPASSVPQTLRIAFGIGSVAVCGIVYIAVAALLKTPEVAVFTGVLRRRLKRTAP
ncbi:MAG: murein biosynthesis integral membrane protein MurJ [Deltaproteobacteria bacterium]|nr:murein biosynthesis integral membrane protein MurJ [Deltaproteobacteria bacterium]